MGPIHFIVSYFFLLQAGCLVNLQKGVSYSALVYFYTLNSFLHSLRKFLFSNLEENAVKE